MKCWFERLSPGGDIVDLPEGKSTMIYGRSPKATLVFDDALVSARHCEVSSDGVFWRVKDLGALFFSALDCGLTRRDLLRFIQLYSGKPWRDCLSAESDLWRRVWRNAARLRSVYQGRTMPPLGSRPIEAGSRR